MAFETTELQRIIPTLLALLEYEWVTGKDLIEPEALDRTINIFMQAGRFSRKSRFFFWLRKVRRQHCLNKFWKEGEKIL
jgi:hypothetical protein